MTADEPMYYDMDGNPMTLTAWGKAFGADPARRRIGNTEVGDVTVSTVWLGLDHNWGSGPPLIFETMTFGEGEWENECWRYSTKEEALAGHERVVEVLRKGQTPDAVEGGAEEGES